MVNKVVYNLCIECHSRTAILRPQKTENVHIQCESKKGSPQKNFFCNIFTQVKNISVKFCQYVAILYLHISTNIGRFILIFNKMA